MLFEAQVEIGHDDISRADKNERKNKPILIIERMTKYRRIRHSPLITIGSIVVIMILISGWVLSKATPSSEAARLRNALLAEVGTKGDHNWLPSKVPSSFNQEDISSASEFSTYISKKLGKVSGSTQLDKSLVIARFLLSNNDPIGGAIMSNTSDALRLIVEKGKGYCADYTQAFNGAAYVNNIPVREWGLSFDSFGGKGHAVNEIFDEKLQKWVLLDTYYGFYLVDRETHIPLSVMEFQNLLRNQSLETLEKKLKIIKIKPNRYRFINDAKLFNYFALGKDHFYLWWGNDALSYDNNIVVSWASQLPRHLEQFVAIALGVHQKIRLLPNKANVDDIASLLELKRQLILAFVVESTLGIVLIYLCLKALVNRKKT